MPGTVTAHGLVLDALGERPRLQELTVEPPGPGEVRVRMRAAGLCHTDVSQVRDARFTPILLGHEGAGEVESVGPGVEDLSAGDPVLVCWKVPCGRCRRCLRDEPHLCEAVVGLAEPRVFRDGEPVGAMLNAGCFCDLVVLPAAGAIPIDADVPFEEAALVGCAVVTGVGAALWTAGVAGGDSVAVFGAGGVGLNVVVGARLAGADTIVAVDPDPHRRELALARGATEAIAPGEPFEPVDFAFEVVGEPAVMEQARRIARSRRASSCSSARPPATRRCPSIRAHSCRGSSGSPVASTAPPARAEHLPQLLAWAADGTIPLADLIGRRVSLDDLEDAFDQPANGGVRTVVTLPVIHRLEELDPAGLEARLAEKPALVLALGTIEWHSHHLPLGLDLLKAQAIAERTAERAEAVLAPAVLVGGRRRPAALHAAALRPGDRARARRRPRRLRRDGLPGDLPAERPLRSRELDRSPPRRSACARGDRDPARRLRAAHRPRRDRGPRRRLRGRAAAARPAGSRPSRDQG